MLELNKQMLTVHGDRILAIRDALLAPPEGVALEPGAPSARPLTSLSGITPEALAQRAVVESHRVQSTDGTEVPYYLVRPAQAPGPMPLLLWIHGGPMSQWGQTWHWRWNALVAVSHGMAVALPNPRGSTGLGHDYKHQIWHNNWGGQCYRDLMCVTDALVARPDIDADRTCAMGGSFGGYMTNWIGGQTDRFRCLVTHASIFDFTQFGLTTDLPAWWALSIGDPWADPEAMGRYSPVRHAPDWTTPVLILHGEKDYRCPIGESLALFEALRRHDVDAELCVFPDENHWILKPRNVVAWYTTVFEFLHRKMR